VAAVILFPAIDLKEGRCVRLIQGDMAQATVFNDDPAAQAADFGAQGFSWLHLVDLNGAFAGQPVNGAAVEAILKADLTNWREIPEVKSLVRFITAQLARRTQQIEQAAAAEDEEAEEEDGESNEGEDSGDDSGDDSGAKPAAKKAAASSSSSSPSADQQQRPPTGRSPLEAQLYAVAQQLVTSAQTMDSEAHLAPFANVVAAVRSRSGAALSPNEARLLKLIDDQIAVIRRGLGATSAAGAKPASKAASPAGAAGAPASAAASPKKSASASPTTGPSAAPATAPRNGNGNGSTPSSPANKSASGQGTPRSAQKQSSP
jgi:hypothetical protein